MDFERWIERLYAWFDRLQKRLSDDWRQHANRRTTLIILIGGILIAFAYVYGIEAPDSFPTGQLVTIPEGQSLGEIAQTLKDSGVIKSPLAFETIVTLTGKERDLHAGDYQFNEPENIFQIARAVSVGAYGLVPLRIRIPEGATMAQMAAIYATALPRFDASNFLAQIPTDEGYLFPDTYFFLPDATESTVIQAMRQDFNTQIATLTPEIASSTHTLEDIVTMASIVEKEAGNTEDRRTIAGILWHRIALGLPLQADPTLVYATGKRDSQLTIKDLTTDSPYNTYVRKGLPPTPIGSPSLDSLQATVNPIQTNYLFYLADKNGVTHYCKTYSCQLQNERRYLGL